MPALVRPLGHVSLFLLRIFRLSGQCIHVNISALEGMEFSCFRTIFSLLFTDIDESYCLVIDATFVVK